MIYASGRINVPITRIIRTFRLNDRAFDGENSDKPGMLDFQLFQIKRLITQYFLNHDYFGKFMIYLNYFENFQNYCFKKGS